MNIFKKLLSKVRAFFSHNYIGPLLLVLQCVGIWGMYVYRKDLNWAFWIWGVVLTVSGLGLVGLKNRTASAMFDWILFGSGAAIGIATAFFMIQA
jgi:hypothetical protein